MNRDYSGITFDQINVFLTAAKYENFSKTAEMLHITQSTVSRKILLLEETLDTVLFTRHQKQVKLSKAGYYLANEMTNITNVTYSVFDKASRINEEQLKSLSIGCINTLDIVLYLTSVIQKFQDQHPQIKVSFEVMDRYKLKDLLVNNMFDIGFFGYSWIKDFSAKLFDHRILSREVPCIILSDRHPLFSHASENIKELLLSPIVAVSGADWYLSVLNEIPYPHGSLTFVPNLDTAVAMLETGSHILFGYRKTRFSSTRKIKAVPMDFLSKSTGLAVIYPRNNNNSVLSDFILMIMSSPAP